MLASLARKAKTVLRLLSNGKAKVLTSPHKDTSDSINQDKDTRGRFCPNPFRQFDVYENGNAYCCCSAWLPTPVGNVNRTDVADIWNSNSMQAIRESIFDGSFRYCNHKVCPVIQNDSLPSMEHAALIPEFSKVIEQRQTVLDELPTFINLCNDASCNLYCPSCRTERINHAKGKAYEERKHLQDKLTQQLFSEPTERDFTVSVTGSGDAFASNVFREFLFDLKGADFPNLKINLQTNGVLLTPKNWRKLEKIHSNINEVIISFDAGSEEVYAVTRRGGVWPLLLENAARMGEVRKAGELKRLRFDYVVQQANYHDMVKFIQIGKRMGADRVVFSMVLDWGTWSPKEYEQQCIWKTSHPEFDQFLAALRDPLFDDPIVDLGNISEYRNLALQA